MFAKFSSSFLTTFKGRLDSEAVRSPMMPSESACRNLAGRINEQAGDNTQAGAFLFGVFNLEGIREFQAIHEAKSIASQVYVREFY